MSILIFHSTRLGPMNFINIRVHLRDGLFNLLEGTIINRDITRVARAELNKQLNPIIDLLASY